VDCQTRGASGSMSSCSRSSGAPASPALMRLKPLFPLVAVSEARASFDSKAASNGTDHPTCRRESPGRGVADAAGSMAETQQEQAHGSAMTAGLQAAAISMSSTPSMCVDALVALAQAPFSVGSSPSSHGSPAPTEHCCTWAADCTEGQRVRGKAWDEPLSLSTGWQSVSSSVDHVDDGMTRTLPAGLPPVDAQICASRACPGMPSAGTSTEVRGCQQSNAHSQSPQHGCGSRIRCVSDSARSDDELTPAGVQAKAASTGVQQSGDIDVADLGASLQPKVAGQQSSWMGSVWHQQDVISPGSSLQLRPGALLNSSSLARSGTWSSVKQQPSEMDNSRVWQARHAAQHGHHESRVGANTACRQHCKVIQQLVRSRTGPHSQQQQPMQRCRMH
jgi:hypothetical protein